MTSEVIVTIQSPTTYFATDSAVLGYYSSGPVVTDSAGIPRSTITLSDGATQPTATNEPSVEDGEDEGSDTDVSAIAGGVVGGAAGFAMILAALWFYLRRKRQKDAEIREIGLGYTGREGKGGNPRPNPVFEMEAESRAD
ncbi:uncharacterized protein BDV14DRAFT_199424 [Aspergillus stella-maris]|uniref:uncharacterized protein n=1 Tax=Aspergillus stella-maris TaxID=1810926 RepID=UPI003CCD2F34